MASIINFRAFALFIVPLNANVFQSLCALSWVHYFFLAPLYYIDVVILLRAR